MRIRTHKDAICRMSDIDQQGKTIVGRAIVYNSLSRDLGGFVERCLPGMATESLRGGLICALHNHDTSQPLGTQKSGTLRAVEDSQGVSVEIDTPDTSFARDMAVLMKRGDGTGMSFAFNPVEERWCKENGLNVVEVVRAEIGEVSVLTGVAPAYPATTASLRAAFGAETDVAAAYGIDMDRLASAFTAIKRGLSLSEDEKKVVKSARDIFAAVKSERANVPLLEAAAERAEKLALV